MTNKEKTIIKRFFKSVENNNDFYNTYYQDENGLYYLINMYSCIRFTVRREDIIKEYGLKSGDPKKISRLNIKEIIENNTNKNYNYYSATVSAADLRTFKAYAKRENKPFLTCYNSTQYIGFNPSYMLDIFDLMKTSENTIYIYDSKSPIILNNVDFDAFILPINTRNTDITTYNNFLTTLNGLKSIQEKEKEEKASEKKNMTVLSLEEEVTYNGFTMWIGGKQYFLMSNKKRVTDEITKDFLKLIAANTTINIDKISESDFKYIKNAINSATITKTTSYYGTEEIYRIETKYNSENFYKNEYDRLIIYNGNMEKIDICTDDMSATDTETPKNATIQDNAADIVKADNCTDATTTDKAATTDTATNDRKKVLHGFYMTFKNRDIFVATNEDMKRRYIVQVFVNEMINISNHLQNITEEKRNNILNDEDVLQETKKRITPATIEEIWTRQENHIRITTNNGNTIINQSLNDFKTIMLDCYSANEGITLAQETAFKFFKGISDINNRTTETTQADARQDTRQTETPAHKSNNCLFVTVAKNLKPEKVAQLQNVANLPTLASIPTYSAYFAQKINNIVNTKRTANNGRKAHKRTNGATLAECSGVLKIANTS